MVEVNTLKLAYVCEDGAGGFVLKVQSSVGGQLIMPLDLKGLARLQLQISKAIAVLAMITPAAPEMPEKYYQK
jgi:hypothetical protein